MIKTQDFGSLKKLNNAGTQKIHANLKQSKMGILKHKDNSFREFRRLCKEIADESSCNAKTKVVANFLSNGTDGYKFRGDLYVWVKLLLPGISKRVYCLEDKHLFKIFSQILDCSQDKMLDDFKGDIAETIANFFEKSKKIQPVKKSKLTVHDVDEFLDTMEALSTEKDQSEELSVMTRQCTINDLKMIIRMIKADLKIKAGTKHVLDGINKDAYEAFKKNKNLLAVVDDIVRQRMIDTISPMEPIKPMLAIAIKTVDEAFKRCPNGMLAETKYDGERVQLHKMGKDFKFFSRSLEPVLMNKIGPLKDQLPKAFPGGCDMILDGEMVLLDTRTNSPLPFGALGIHKAANFEFANPCIFIFDCLFHNGESLINVPLKDRKKHMRSEMKEVDHFVKFSETTFINKKEQLEKLYDEVLKKGLEGLILKDVNGIIEPGKRRWFKVKKDYSNNGAMVDSADLSVLGAWYGSGTKAGKLAVFLMGCHNKITKQWYTVTKVDMGIESDTLSKLQGELIPNMVKIRKKHNKIPSWLNCSSQITPDFVVKDPTKSPVWEIIGTEFTKSKKHAGLGFTIQFPRVVCFRIDKDWKTATDLRQLRALYHASKPIGEL